MQLLFETSEEMGAHAGLGLLPGSVKCFPQNGLKVPQTGWNQLNFAHACVRVDLLLDARGDVRADGLVGVLVAAHLSLSHLQ